VRELSLGILRRANPHVREASAIREYLAVLWAETVRIRILPVNTLSGRYLVLFVGTGAASENMATVKDGVGAKRGQHTRGFGATAQSSRIAARWSQVRCF